MTRLNDVAVSSLPPDIALPGYDRAAVKIGVVHLGLGAFHRAHQAVVFDDALKAGDLRWGVLGASLRSPGVRDQLNPQDGLYILIVNDGAKPSLRVIGAVKSVLVGPEDPKALVAAMADPDVHIVSLTVTEKGYRLDPATGDLRVSDPEVRADLADISRPVTAPGFIVAALQLRKAKGLKPFTVISCDNLPNNGRRIRAGVLEMARRVDPPLADWIAKEGAFPQTMIDRIVPATGPQDIAKLETHLGLRDEGMVKTEPFTQWVIEDEFAGERPDLAAYGVQLTQAVAPWEDAKLRLLNGAHSLVAYLGALAGYPYVHEAVAQPSLRAVVERLWDESAATLTPPPGLDIAAYRHALMARFDNPALNHQTYQIAMDGSQKLPQRLLAPIKARLEAGASIDALALGVAAWMSWQGGVDDKGQTYEVQDPLADETSALLSMADSPAARVLALLSLSAVFPPALAKDEGFIAAVTQAYTGLADHGAIESARRLTGRLT